MYACMYTCTYYASITYKCMCTHTHTHARTPTLMHVGRHVRKYVRTHVRAYIRMPVCMYVCMYVCMPFLRQSKVSVHNILCFNCNISWGERNTAVTQFLVTLQERQKTFPFCSILLYATETYRIMIYKHKK